MSKLTPEEALQFLENFRLMMGQKDLPKKAISIRIPENIINMYKAEAAQLGRPYQHIMIDALRSHFSNKLIK